MMLDVRTEELRVQDGWDVGIDSGLVFPFCKTTESLLSISKYSKMKLGWHFF